MIPFIDLQTQRRRIEGDVQGAIAAVLEHGQFILGPEVEELERNLSAFCRTKHTLGCANGTDAIVLALMALGIGEGDAVFAPSFTFVATVEAVKLVRATPVFVDVCKDTFNLCPDSLEAAITHIKGQSSLRPKAIIPVDLFGQPADYRKIEAIARQHGLAVIADAAQSFGARLDDKPVGAWGDIATTSFFPAKPLGCYGDGGAIFTNNDELLSLIRSYRNHGQGKDRYDNIRVGLNSRLDTLQAAVLLQKMKIFPDEIAARDTVAQNYTRNLPERVVPQATLAGATSVWAQYTVVVDARDRLRAALGEAGIPTAVYYPKPNHLQAPYVDAPRAPGGLPVTEYLQERVFSLPMHPYLDDDTQARILSVLAKAMN